MSDPVTLRMHALQMSGQQYAPSGVDLPMGEQVYPAPASTALRSWYGEKYKAD